MQEYGMRIDTVGSACRIGIVDVDGGKYPNLALMKISAWHKQRGDSVEWCNGFLPYDRVYKARVFDDTYTQELDFAYNADEIIKGGTGYALGHSLPEEVEHIFPDYSIYGIDDTAYGFLTRGCPRHCNFCIVSKKEGRKSVAVADVSEFWNGQKHIELLDPNILACKERERLLKELVETKAYVNFSQGLDVRMIDDDVTDLINKMKLKNIHFAWDNYPDESVLRGLERYAKRATHKVSGAFASVYVLTNFNTTHEEDYERVMKLRDMGYDPYVMVYDKPNAPWITKRLQYWVNNRIFFKSCAFEDFDPINRHRH